MDPSTPEGGGQSQLASLTSGVNVTARQPNTALLIDLKNWINGQIRILRLLDTYAAKITENQNPLTCFPKER